MTELNRRAFLKSAAVASAASVASTFVPAVAQQAPPEGTQGHLEELRWHRAPCHLCGVGCGLLIGVQNGRAVAARGDPDSPTGQGLGCVKGYHAVQTLYGRDRFTRAMIRRRGVLVAVPLAEALDLVSRRLRETLTQHGPEAVGVYGSQRWTIPDAYVAAKLFKGGLGTNNVETSARLHAGSARTGLETSFGLDGAIGCYEDIDQADVFVLWNVNLAETDPVLFSRMLARKRSNPAVRIVDLSTRTTRTSYPADESLLHLPQSELAIANAICHEIVARRWVRKDFVDQHVAFKRGKIQIGTEVPDGPLVEEAAAAATWDDYVTFLADYSPERVQGMSGVSPARLRWLASLYGDSSRKVMSFWGANVNGSIRGTWMNNLLYNIHLLTGKVATPGNSPFCVTGLSGLGSGVHDGGASADALPSGVTGNAEDRRRAAAIWKLPADAISSRPGHHPLGMFRALERGDLRFLWIQATNPMVSLPNLDRYRRAAATPDRFIVVSEAYPTPTTDVADVVLPAAMWIEREGIVANPERRVQHWDRLVEPPGDAASDAWHMVEVARRLGRGELFPWNRERHVEQIWEEYRRFHQAPASAVAPLAVLRAQPGVQWPFERGRATERRYNTLQDPSADPKRGAFDFYGHPDHRAWIWLRPYQPAAESPDRAYPFWLGTATVLEHSGTGTLTQRVPTLHRSIPQAYVEIHREDARALGVRSGERVRLVNRRGALELQARIDYRAQPPRGQVVVPTFDEGLLIERLTLDAGCPLSGQPETSKCAVRVERAGSGSGP
jgi:nitrate reductase (cytochrome)